ncbi:GAF domain-containing protein [Arsenicicoccus piscis]|uniref:helix-turn-helix domain-containing protein n=1 Tax=Arsenicicoccus piscis TaxID=673954 RepID=UPI001F4CC57A|nr:GAF domain-containing protein [Arsenicicoccus piscis]MCH8628114.1 GAF domain-containing protein [Arsenicicoccus piscis]
MTSDATTQPRHPRAEHDLLRLLAEDRPARELSAVDAPTELVDLALTVRTRIDALRRREQALVALADSARDLATSDTQAQTLHAIVRRARALLRTDVAYILLYDRERGDTYMEATDGSVSAAFQSLRVRLGDGLGGLVAKTRKPYWTADYPHDDRFTHTRAIDDAVGEEGIVAICGTPLLVDEEFVGVLFASNRSPRPFDRDEVVLLGSFAALAAAALVKTRSVTDSAAALAALSEAHETVRRHTEGVERAAAAHDRFTELVLRGGGVDDITDALVQSLGGWAVLVDVGGQTRSAAGDPAPTESVVEPDAVLEAARAATRATPHGRTWVAPVAAASELLGALVVGGPRPLDDADRRTVERAAVVTALVLTFERYAADGRRRLRGGLVTDLVQGRGRATGRRQGALAEGIDLREPFCLAVIRPVDPADGQGLARSVDGAVGDRGLVGRIDDDVVVLLPAEDAAKAAERLARLVRGVRPVTIGTAGPGRGVEAPGTLYASARRTAIALEALGRAGEHGAAEGLGFAGLVVADQPDVGAFVDGMLGPVLRYDAEHGTDLVGTLDAYFAAGASPREASRRLHVHPNTVGQRLARVATLLGAGWTRPEVALEVQLALRMRRLLPAAPSTPRSTGATGARTTPASTPHDHPRQAPHNRCHDPLALDLTECQAAPRLALALSALKC